MRGDLTAAFLHSPDILFLDEPTIGLDIQSKKHIRSFVKDINSKNKVTFILTTHDLSDVQKLCSRLIIINDGVIVEDDSVDAIIHRIVPYRVLIVNTSQPAKKFENKYCELIKKDGNKLHLRFDKKKITASELIAKLSKELKIIDLSVKEPDIEDVIESIVVVINIT